MQNQMKIQPDDETYVPSNNNDMVRVYRAYVNKLVTKFNRVSTNFDDLVQHVWQQLFAVNVLEKYKTSLGSQPRQLTGEQAAAYLQMTWSQFKVVIWRGMSGDVRDNQAPKEIREAVFARDQGVCCDASHQEKGPFNAAKFELELMKTKETDPEKYIAIRRQMLTNHGISFKKEHFWVAEKIPGTQGRTVDNYRTVCIFCQARNRKESGMVVSRTKSEWAPKPIKGGWASKGAIYDLIDIEKLRMVREQLKRTKKHEEIQFTMPQTRSRFKMYLHRAVHNIYCNWCRTRSRKYKELYLAPTEEGQAWESFLEDSGSDNQEAKLILTETVNEDVDAIVEKLSRRAKTGEVSKEQICQLLAEGYTLSEIIKELELPRAVLQVVTGRYR